MMEYFHCYHSYLHKTKSLTDEQAGKLWRALMLYAETGKRTALAEPEAMAFDFIADDIDRAAAKYAGKCARNKKSALERWDAAEPEAESDADAADCDNADVSVKNDAKRDAKTTVCAPDPESGAVRKYVKRGKDTAYSEEDGGGNSGGRTAKKTDASGRIDGAADAPDDANACERMQTHANADNTKTNTTTIVKETPSDEGVKKSGKRFSPPTIMEISAYIAEKGIGEYVNAVRFWTFYDQKGWMVGKNRMQNWKSAVSGWAAREKEERGGGANGARSGTKPTRAASGRNYGQYTNAALSAFEIDLSAEDVHL